MVLPRHSSVPEAYNTLGIDQVCSTKYIYDIFDIPLVTTTRGHRWML